jgi:hypothetical protein
MTAIVGVLNKHAVAIAADSAVTMSGPAGRKVLNRANKIFTLSKYHPIGVMIYNSANLMSVPWDIIVKLYRKELKDKMFLSVSDYANDFLAFLYSKKFFSDKESHLAYLYNLVYDIVINELGREAGRLCGGITDSNKIEVVNKIGELLGELKKSCDNREKCEKLSDYQLADFKIYANDLFDGIMEELKNIDPSPELRLKLEETIHSLLVAKENITPYSGLIFVGYGESELYPSLTPVNVSLVVDGRLRYYIDKDKEVSITESNYSAIVPFAQTDVINTILSGVDPHLETIFVTNLKKTISKYNVVISDLIRHKDSVLADQILNLDTKPLEEMFFSLNQEIKKKEYTTPLVRAISSLEKEDLVDVAESLISLTSLKRRMTFAEESVGGPVDVAVISKCDGFIWIKRKHYFDPTLNSHFFNNYFK